MSNTNKKYIDNTFFTIYILLFVTSLVSFIIWLIQGSIYDEMFNTICIIIISLFFFHSIYSYLAYQSLSPAGLCVFAGFVVIILGDLFLTNRAIQTAAQKKKDIESLPALPPRRLPLEPKVLTERVDTDTVRSVTVRNVAYAFGLLTILPVLTISLTNILL